MRYACTRPFHSKSHSGRKCTIGLHGSPFGPHLRQACHWYISKGHLPSPGSESRRPATPKREIACRRALLPRALHSKLTRRAAAELSRGSRAQGPSWPSPQHEIWPRWSTCSAEIIRRVRRSRGAGVAPAAVREVLQGLEMEAAAWICASEYRRACAGVSEQC